MNFVVIGAGAWGTAFALHLQRVGHHVVLVPRRSDHAEAMNATRENADYLPGQPLPAALKISADLPGALRDAEVVLLACPSQALRETSTRLKDHHAQPRVVLSLAKGLELKTHLRPSEVISEVLPGIDVGSITGPTNAAEVGRGFPAAMVLATNGSPAAAEAVQSAISGRTLRVYTSSDLAGLEFGGSLKNIYAVAAGCSDGLRLGDNAKAALLTRSLAEMIRVGTVLGARAETFYGLSGFGDLVATCHGGWSRNRDFGFQIGSGKTVAQLMEGRKTVVEGYRTTQSFHGLCTDRGIDAPILRQTYAILFEGCPPAQALTALMTRGLKRE